jgi:aminoglycoside phosphotransferase (APT) family kinase protein
MTTQPSVIHSIQHIRPDCTVLTSRSISNSDPHKMTAVEIAHPSGDRETLIIRRQPPDAISHEARLLRLLAETDVPVPAVYDVQQGVMIQSYINGESVFSPADVKAHVTRMAQMLARIHQIELSESELRFLPSATRHCQAHLDNVPDKPQANMAEPQIRQTLAQHWQTLAHNPATLLHGDFWPGNVLLQEHHIIGVVDWEDAMHGDPLADLGNSRREMLWFFGKEAMQHFTKAYQKQMPHLDYSSLPLWDLCMALNPVGKVSSWCLADDAKNRLRSRQRWFVEQACDAIQSR